MKNVFRSFTIMASIGFFLINFQTLYATKTILDDTLFNATDVTSVIQNAISSAVDTIIIKNVGAPWIVKPLFVDKNNKTFLFENGVVLKAKIGTYTGDHDKMFDVRDRSNINFIGYGATLQMQKSDASSEWNHCIDLRSSTNVKIYGLTLKDAGGDGVAIEGFGLTVPYSSYIHVKDCILENNGRNNISIINADHVTIESCIITKANGNAPQNGIDIEPDDYNNLVTNILITKCYFEDNAQPAISAYLGKQDITSVPLSIKIQDCYFNNTAQASFGGRSFAISGMNNADVKGSIEVVNCLFENARFTAIEITKPAIMPNFSLKLINCVLRNNAHTRKYYDAPIIIWGDNLTSQAYGGVEFIDCVIYDVINRPFIRTMNESADSKGCANIKGNITVINPNGTSMSLGTKAYNNPIKVTALASSPNFTVKSEVNTTYTYEGKTTSPASITFTRSAADNIIPLALVFDLAGTATNRIDYSLSPGFSLIPPQSTTQSVNFYARQDEMDELQESILLTISPRNDMYAIGNVDAKIMFIGEKILAHEKTTASSYFSIFPNPANHKVTISNAPLGSEIKILDLQGRELLSQKTISENTELNLQALPQGLYMIRVGNVTEKLTIE